MNRKPSKAIKRRSWHFSKWEAKQEAEKRLKSFVRKFLSATILAVIPLSLIPEKWFWPLNRFTAFVVGEAMLHLGVDTVVRGDCVSIVGFSVDIVAECTAVHLIAFYAAFIFAFPATRYQKWIGLVSGALLLFFLNIARIATAILIGRHFPAMFDAAHIYLGQLGMLAAVIIICIMWCSYVSDPSWMKGSVGFFARFIVFSGALFIFWLPLNKVYVKTIDGLICWFFDLYSTHLIFPKGHSLYYQAFSLITLTGLMLAVKDVKPAFRMRWITFGLATLTIFQIAHRLCNVWISAFNVQWVVPVAQAVQIAGVYILPLTITICFLMKTRISHFNRLIILSSQRSNNTDG